MREEGWILKCNWMEEWATDVIAERDLWYRLVFQMGKPRGSIPFRHGISPVTNSLVLGIWRVTVRIYWRWTVLRDEITRVILNILERLYSISATESPQRLLWSWEYGEPMSEFIGVGQFDEMSGEGWILKCDWIEEWTTDVIVERELRVQAFVAKRVNHTSSVNSRLRIIANKDIWVSLFQSSRS
ncbi:hypothetical protein CEXT_7661 [Caerostris extrusa]|uniref:Uncharacterized protein n=1 Tax=Caerostris extrusa TaxID=172846 RepID=A0AAV4XRJ5_CAEEX|nr:hypothetical protein CEXT_7661 [Caerostris extrusa]